MNTAAGVHNELPHATANGRARAAALQAHRTDASAGVGTLEYRSNGHVLIIGPAADALRCAEALAPPLRCVVLTPPGAGQLHETVPEIISLSGRITQLEGYLGHFEVGIEQDGNRVNPARLFDADTGYVDLVLDLAAIPSLRQDVPPLGYFAPREPRARERALRDLRELVGEFEKPKFFVYDAAICAHGRSGLAGCRRCLDACPTLAIRSLGETVEVNPYLCQGAGSCASACPTGAIRYDYPGPGSLLGSVRDALRQYLGNDGRDPQVLFYDSATGQQALETLAARLPESVLPFQVEELGSVGLDSWLAVLAYGARRVVLFTTQAIPRPVLREMTLQLSYAEAILSGLGYRRDCLQLVLDGGREETLAAACARALPPTGIPAAGFTSFDDKRTTLRLAIDHLYTHAPEPQPWAELPDDAPFGAIEIAVDRCTLCMACVAVCPSKALYAGNDRPALQFIEANCVQCGLCHTACPEDAVRLVPRISYDQTVSRALRTLHEEEPFRCVRCGKPFATRAVVERMTERLAEHWMFRDEQARRRIQMCQDCKVLDVFEQAQSPNVYDKPVPHA